MYSQKTFQLSKIICQPLAGRKFLHVSACLLNDEKKKTFYSLLDIPKSATQTEVKEAYYKLSKIYHPDVARDEDSLKMFREITEAYDILGNVKSRKDYDLKVGFVDDYDTSKTKFYTTLYADKIRKGVNAPDYDNLRFKVNKQEAFEKQEYTDRRMEIQMKKTEIYPNHDNFASGFWLIRFDSMCLVLFPYILFYYCDFFYDITSALGKYWFVANRFFWHFNK